LQALGNRDTTLRGGVDKQKKNIVAIVAVDQKVKVEMHCGAGCSFPPFVGVCVDFVAATSVVS